MPFDDELSPVGVVVAYRDRWAIEMTVLAEMLQAAVPSAITIEHVGSTAVPGMAAKDCLDVMVVVPDLSEPDIERGLSALGYRRRPEAWNNLEEAAGQTWPKLTFAPPVGARPVNVHVRTAASETARVTLLFRDHLRANPARARWWSELKLEAARAADDLAGYGRIKYPAWCLLMDLAESWAAEVGWRAPDYLDQSH